MLKTTTDGSELGAALRIFTGMLSAEIYSVYSYDIPVDAQDLVYTRLELGFTIPLHYDRAKILVQDIIKDSAGVFNVEIISFVIAARIVLGLNPEGFPQLFSYKKLVLGGEYRVPYLGMILADSVYRVLSSDLNDVTMLLQDEDFVVRSLAAIRINYGI